MTGPKPAHRPGVNPDGSPGVRVQVILSAEQVRAIDETRRVCGRGPFLRILVERWMQEGTRIIEAYKSTE